MSGSSPTLNEAYFFVGFNFQRPLGGISVCYSSFENSNKTV
jgi:hypothetical protein